ncbi:MAG: bifunctional glycosyltransferase family 2/GtrA family protein [Clostridia bacterium]|nr:bifunctional glycosyltransferase family 2/GtrA family protein [Clostridia bacterium]
MNIIAVIPAYEPDEQLLPLLETLRASQVEALVVDDGSGTEYDAVFEAASRFATVLRYEVNGGKGHALKHAFQYLSEHGSEGDVYVTMDSDGQHTVEDASKLCAYVEAHPSDIALGSRQLDKSAPLRSRMGNAITRHVFSMASKCHIHDTQSGLRAFSRGMLPFLLSVQGERYEYEMNMLIDCARKGIHVEEIGIQTIYYAGNKGSHFNALKDSFRIYKEILKFCSSSFASFLIDYAIYSLLVAIFGVGFADPATVIARIFSASVNFTLNRTVVFNGREKGPLLQSILKYALLAVCILAANTGLIHLLTQVWHWNAYLSKILVEIVLFIVNWLVQRNLVYYKKKKKT